MYRGFIGFNFQIKLYFFQIVLVFVNSVEPDEMMHYACFFLFFFYLILYIPSTIFQLYRDGSSRVEPVLS